MTDGDYLHLAEEYDQVLGRLAERTWRQGILAEMARLDIAPSVIVDLGAGTGIGGRLLAGTGCPARRVGIDHSAPMLRLATGRYEWTVLADVVDPPLRTGSVDVVVSGFDTLNYLDPAVLANCLRGVSRCLRPGGWLIFDYSSPMLLRRQFSRVERVPGGTVYLRHSYRPDRDCSISEVERRGDDRSVRWRETHVHYAVGADRLHELAAAAGLDVVRVRNLHGSRFSPNANTHVWVLARAGSRAARRAGGG